MKLVIRIFAMVLAIGFALHARADWPDRPLKIIVPFPAGNASDVAMRIVGEKLSAQLGQPVVVENKVGAGGAIGTDFGAKQPADGYTLSMGSTGPLAIARWLRPDGFPYDSEKDFVAVGAIAWAPQVLLVRKELPVANFKEFLAYAKRPATRLHYGTAGNGTTSHLVISQLLHQTGIVAEHIPYRGGASSIMDLIGGQLDFVTENIPPIHGLLMKGQVKPLAVTSAARIPLLPDVPTLKEQGLEHFDLQGWILMVAPARTPAAIVRRLTEASESIMKMPDVRKRLNDLGLIPMDLPRDKLAGFIPAESRKWGEVVRASGAARHVR
jgi:tripartite-type tricarboxylate transporter receptor subunit TctC